MRSDTASQNADQNKNTITYLHEQLFFMSCNRILISSSLFIFREYMSAHCKIVARADDFI